MKRITIDERMLIQACLTKDMNLTEIAKRLNRNKSTISREINSHLIIKDGYSDKDCIHRKEHVLCNSCPYRGPCGHEKHYYNYEEADKASKYIRSSSREYTKLTIKEIEIINDILIEQVRRLRQSLHHVYISNPCLSKICSEKTIRRHIYKGLFEVKAHELRKYVVYKHSYEKPKIFQLRDITILIGRQFDDYLKYCERHKRANIVQYDSVIGKITDELAILTITFIKYGFQFGLLIRKSDPNDVVRKLKKLFRTLGNEMVKEIFQINLADNGIEFSYFNKIEYDDNGEFICNTFFTRPYKATDKPHCERYHELIRYMIPKGKSLDSLTQEKLNWMFSQINSYVRKGLNDQTPYDLIKRKFGKEFLDKIGISRVEKKKVNLSQIC
ncbi:MAG: helix-turn-helix domain-containing protein [Bacilli bacterium]|jgi:IS30 family transposase|nr:helix-turn-helix domain-containing protein [Bacilli bacterium]